MISEENVINIINNLKLEIDQEKNLKNKELLEERIIALEELLIDSFVNDERNR
jgi:hypothetical protein